MAHLDIFQKTIKMVDHLDRLSDLPELALGRIVSFLPFKEAGRTCILSKRWRGIWRFPMSNIERFDEYILYTPLPTGSSLSNKERRAIRRHAFINFVKNIVLGNRYDPHPPEEMDTFRFSFYDPDDYQPDVDRLIRYVISKNVKDLDLDFSSRVWKKDHADTKTPSFELPETLYQYERFESLKLSACTLKVPYLTNLRGLKNLSLSWIELKPSDIQSLITNCELLESFSLKKCRKLDIIDIRTSDSSRLRSFVVDDCSSLGELLLHIPTLRYFKYFGTIISPFYLESLRDIVEADFDFGTETEYINLGENLYEIFCHIDNLQVLTVCSYITQVIAGAEDLLDMHDLRHLTIKTGLTDNELLGIAYLFRSFPNLESLTIRLGTVTSLTHFQHAYGFISNKFWRTNIIHTPCLEEKLKEVRFEGFTGKTSELDILYYLLTRGGGLQRLTIVLAKLKEEKDREAIKKKCLYFISWINKASENVLIQVL